MSNLHTEPAEDEDEEQDNELENEQNKDMPNTNQTFDVAKRTIAPSTGTMVALSPEELEVLKKRKPMEHLKTIINARSSLAEKSPSTSTVSGGQSTSKSGDELLLKIKKKPSTLICSNSWRKTLLLALGSKIS